MRKRRLTELEIETKNMPKEYRRDFYHRLLLINWTHFFVYYVMFFIGINLVFAMIYFFNTESLHTNHPPFTFFDCFAFSVQTFSTIGYGAIYPQTPLAHILVAIQSMLSLVSTAAMAGLFFAKFSRPSAKIIFTDNIVITNFEGKKTLMFRVANARHNRILSANMNLNFTYMKDTLEGVSMRRFEVLKLVRDQSPLFSLTWLVMHTIDESSPFFGKSIEDLKNIKVELYAIIHGIDSSFNQTIHQVKRYTPKDFVLDKQFKDVITVDQHDVRTIDYKYFHDTI